MTDEPSVVFHTSEFVLTDETLEAMAARNNGGDPLDPDQASMLLEALMALRARMRERAEKHEARADELVARTPARGESPSMLASVHAAQAEELRFLLSGQIQKGDW